MGKRSVKEGSRKSESGVIYITPLFTALFLIDSYLSFLYSALFLIYFYL